MPRKTVHAQLRLTYLKYMAVRDLIDPLHDDPIALTARVQLDMATLRSIRETRYLRGRVPVEKSGCLALAFKWGGQPENHHRFVTLFRVTPTVFEFILLLISGHPIFTNNSHVPQAPVDVQLAVTLYRLGRYGNGASLEDIARSMLVRLRLHSSSY
ncbi:hypothetical protein DFP72DRAFT_548602 [Ephemerocybe angulata]|uniref:Uncharacterized protein n=1 Tax=Ephemerocybe angulata TaxID=980116 RepID=A0A8H6HNN6_9AGAR|nr:hypothetical protein DFP72DRAFT_548602 [Tulosesus angulatus]